MTDAIDVIGKGGEVLNAADEELFSLLDQLDGQVGETGATGDTHTLGVAEVAQKNQGIQNTISAASQCISTAKQNDQKVTGAQTR